MIETPFGNYPGATAERVVEVAAEILRHLRYVRIETTFDAICELFPGAQSDGERKHLLHPPILWSSSIMRAAAIHRRLLALLCHAVVAHDGCDA
jgi:hypothetical protein